MSAAKRFADRVPDPRRFYVRRGLGSVSRAQEVAATSEGRLAVGETFSRIHIPARPCPGTAHKIMNDPALFATNWNVSVCPLSSPTISLIVMARANVGSTGPAGIGLVVSATSAECGRFGSLFVN